MVTPAETHEVAITPPWYAPAGRTMALHRYLETSFVDLFRADIAAAPETNPSLFQWQDEDRIPGTAVLKLRRPLHRSFHIAAWEATCRIPNAVMGQPAIDPAKISSAGFVLRQGDPGQPQGFLLAAGKPAGWAPVEIKADPDAARHVKALGLVQPTAQPNPGYTGEETYPLHKTMVGTARRHTVLYGFLPIGGAEYVPPNPAAPDPSTIPEDLVWPFGLADRQSSGPPGSYTADLQIGTSTIATPLAAMLRVLLGRYGLVLPAGWTDPANAALVTLLNGLAFFTDPPGGTSGDALRAWAAAHNAGITLGDALRDTATAQALMTALAQPATATLSVPAAAPIAGDSRNLLVPEATATQFRAILRLRLTQAVQASATDVPIPKLDGGPAGRYHLVPFARTLCPDGCERIAWGPPSEAFAVATLFDPDAARPTRIQMPDITDAMGSLNRSVSLDLPAGLAKILNGANTSTALQPSSLDLRFICSFSLPAITICASLALSIMLSLLNISLQWMAWVKICLPFPARK